MMHGFLNVFGAGILAHAHTLDEKFVHKILEAESARGFSFEGPSFACKGISVDHAQIEDARRSAVTSFGSCSFDEPREDLRALGLL
jgi:hypothetical protein